MKELKYQGEITLKPGETGETRGTSEICLLEQKLLEP